MTSSPGPMRGAKIPDVDEGERLELGKRQKAVATEGLFGPLIETTMRVVSYNLWWRFGPWEERFPAIVSTLRDLDPDVCCLQEVWDEAGRNQAAELDGPRGPLAAQLPAGAVRGLQRPARLG